LGSRAAFSALHNSIADVGSLNATLGIASGMKTRGDRLSENLTAIRRESQLRQKSVGIIYTLGVSKF
jgi:hypothetical protein